MVAPFCAGDCVDEAPPPHHITLNGEKTLRDFPFHGLPKYDILLSFGSSSFASSVAVSAAIPSVVGPIPSALCHSPSSFRPFLSLSAITTKDDEDAEET